MEAVERPFIFACTKPSISILFSYANAVKLVIVLAMEVKLVRVTLAMEVRKCI